MVGHCSSEAAAVLACPVRGCGAPLVWEKEAVCCPQGHSFDIARSGYCNLLQPQDKRSSHPGDSKEAVQARRRTLERGLGVPLREALAAFLNQWQSSPCTRVLDVGCGEGYFLSALTQELELKGWGVDLSAYAIEAAARAHPDCAWLVANADRRLPFRSGSFPLLLSIASRKNGEEFHRVLAEEGRLLVVVPAPDDLRELREALLGQAIDKDRAASAAEALGEWFVLERESLTRSTHQLDTDALEDLLKGSYRGARRSEQQRFSEIRGLEVTLSYRLLGYRRKNQ